eukprot:scaffold49285_cov32-Phaeocystis_antarctica.AAC.1
MVRSWVMGGGPGSMSTAVRPPPGRGRSGCLLRQVRAASPAASATEQPTSRDRTPGPGPWSHKVDAAG